MNTEYQVDQYLGLIGTQCNNFLTDHINGKKVIVFDCQSKVKNLFSI